MTHPVNQEKSRPISPAAGSANFCNRFSLVIIRLITFSALSRLRWRLPEHFGFLASMEPTLAALIGLPPSIGLFGHHFVWYCLPTNYECNRRDLAADDGGMLIGSRSVSQWLVIFHFPIAIGSVEGNPLDPPQVYGTLIAAGDVLDKRRVSLGALFTTMGGLLHSSSSAPLPSFVDFPSAFKRWIMLVTALICMSRIPIKRWLQL